MKKKHLEGLIAAPYTPMNNDGSLKLSVIEQYSEYLIKKKCVTGVFICGTTGESVSLSVIERKKIAEKWIKETKGRLKVIVHIGSMSQPDCMNLASHAQEIGADAIAAMAPCFFKPQTIYDLIDFFKPIAESASNLPFYYYNMPSITGVYLPVQDFLIEGKKQIPNLAGVKFTHNNLMEMQQCIHADNGSFEVLHGFDEILITGLSIGAEAAVGSTYNYIPELYDAIMKSIKVNDLETARKMQWKAVEIIDVLIKHGGGVRAGKIFMKLAGIDCGPCRLPISPCYDKELEDIKSELKKTVFFEYVNKSL